MGDKLSSEQPTDDALLRVLTRALNWQCVSPPPLSGIYEIHDAEGQWIAQSSTEEWAWQNAYKHLACLTSVDAALSLPWPERRRLVMTDGNPYMTHEFHEVKLYTGDAIYEATAPTLACALCECFAQWWTATQETNP